MKNLFAVFLCACLLLASLFALPGCASSEGAADLEKVRAAGKLVVGMECAYAPYNWSVAAPGAYTVEVGNGLYADGYDVQIARRIADHLGVALEIRPIEWDGLIPALQSGSIDAVIAGMSPTEDRRLSVDFSDVYLASNLVIVCRKDSTYAGATRLSDFAGARLCAQQNTFHYTVIDQIAGVKKQTALKSFAALAQALSNGTIDGYVCERPHGLAAAAADPNMTFVEFADGNGFTYDPAEASIAVALRKGSTLTAEINAVIAAIPTSERENLMTAAIARQPLSDDDE